MPSINKAIRRDNKISKRKTGHQVDIRNTAEEEKKKRAKEWERRRQEKEASLGG